MSDDKQKSPPRDRGRPVEHPLPDPISDTPENIMRAIVATPPKKREDWKYLEESGRS